jgi:hypothetical protein
MVDRGHYALQLRSLLKHFPREHVRVVILERWSQDPQRLLSDILEDLKLRPRVLPVRVIHRRNKTNASMDDDTRALLIEHYRDYNRQLEELLGEEIPEWT